MSRSSHAYVRGNTLKFYALLAKLKDDRLPIGPPVWICGDCHIGNLGPVADANGRVQIEIRDLDQTVIGNPAHDLIRLGLSLASAARGSNLPGVTTARMLEAMIDGYECAFEDDGEEEPPKNDYPQSIDVVMKLASTRTWKRLAKERIKDVKPTIPLGKRFWPISDKEKGGIEQLFEGQAMRRLATMLRCRDDDAEVQLLDAAYWVKGCSSLGKLRYAVLLGVNGKPAKGKDLCLMDIKEAVEAVAPHDLEVAMPQDHAKRVVEGARHIAPFLGERMRAARLLDQSVFVRELLPQDLKIEIARLSEGQATKTAWFLAWVVGVAHSRQMDSAVRKSWQSELRKRRSKTLDAPSWLWSSIVELLISHEGEYLEHCRRYAMEASQASKA
jgi:uncharacterized protein (DUF2252 family)